LVSYTVIVTISRVPIMACAFLLICSLILATLLDKLLCRSYILLDDLATHLSSGVHVVSHSTPATSITTFSTVICNQRIKSRRKRALLSEPRLDINKLSRRSVDLLLEEYAPSVNTAIYKSSKIMDAICLPGMLLMNILETTIMIIIIYFQLAIVITQCSIHMLLSPAIRIICGLLKIAIVSANSFSYEFWYNVISLLIRPSRPYIQSLVNESTDSHSLSSHIAVSAFCNPRASPFRRLKSHKSLPCSSTHKLDRNNIIPYDNYTRTVVITSYRNCTQTRRTQSTQGYRIPTTVSVQNFRLCAYNKHETPKGRKSYHLQQHRSSMKQPAYVPPKTKTAIRASPYRHLRRSQRRDILRRSVARANISKTRMPLKTVDRYCKPHSTHYYFSNMHAYCHHHTQFTMRHHRHSQSTIPSPGQSATMVMDHQSNQIIDHSSPLIPPNSMSFPKIIIVSFHQNPFISLDASSTPPFPSIS
jgi:hypothetical protein